MAASAIARKRSIDGSSAAGRGRGQKGAPTSPLNPSVNTTMNHATELPPAGFLLWPDTPGRRRLTTVT
jgi:hypothetical protein